MTTAELLILQYGNGSAKKQSLASTAVKSAVPYGPKKAAWYRLLVPVTAPRR